MAFAFPRCRIVPLPDHQAEFQIDRRPVTRWHFAASHPRPFFYPLAAPSGTSVTRMGHPGAANHDHHRSVWFAHNRVLGIDFWSDQTDARIRQHQWLVYHDSDELAAMGVELGWYDGHDPQPLIRQRLVAIVRPGNEFEFTLELQSTFEPIADAVQFDKTNFGFLAVRVAKSISAHFGGGQLHDSEGRVGEAAIFGQATRWMDYSGPTTVADDGRPLTEGVTYFDHPDNVGYPARWHVREDGWMGASACRTRPLVTRRDDPLRLRYLLHVHRDGYCAAAAARVADQFAAAPWANIERSARKHQFNELRWSEPA